MITTRMQFRLHHGNQTVSQMIGDKFMGLGGKGGTLNGSRKQCFH